MLNIIEREIVWKYYTAKRILSMVTKSRTFAKTEHAGTDLTGKWDETILNASDVNAYQDASKILSFSTANGTKGSHVQDLDGNVLLDLCGTENQPLGHNHDALLRVRVSITRTYILVDRQQGMGPVHH